MSPLDILILIALIAGAFFGWKKGIIQQIGRITGLICGILICRVFGGKVTALFIESPDGSHNDLLTCALIYLIIFIVVYIAISAMMKGVKLAVHKLSLGFIDRLGGAVFCIFEYLFFLSLLLNVWITLMPDTNIEPGKAPWRSFTMRLAPETLASAQTFWDKYEENRKGGNNVNDSDNQASGKNSGNRNYNSK